MEVARQVSQLARHGDNVDPEEATQRIQEIAIR